MLSQLPTRISGSLPIQSGRAAASRSALPQISRSAANPMIFAMRAESPFRFYNYRTRIILMPDVNQPNRRDFVRCVTGAAVSAALQPQRGFAASYAEQYPDMLARAYRYQVE